MKVPSMSGIFTRGPELSLELHNPPKGNRYSVIDPEVSGRFILHHHQELHDVEIRIRLIGKANIFYTDREHRSDFELSTSSGKGLVQQKFRFLEVTVSSLLYERELQKDEVASDNFAITFPSNFALPSSCKKFGDHDMGHIDITYKIKVEAAHYGSQGNFKTIAKAKQEILYQSGVNFTPWNQIQALRYKKRKVFKNKFRKFCYDESIGALVPYSKKSYIIPSKLARKLLRETGSNKMTDTITLDMELMVMSVFDLKQSFASQLLLEFSCNLGLMGIDSNQSKELILNGQSTQLGAFRIDLLEVLATHHFRVFCKQKKVITDTITSRLLDIEFTDFNIDISDFSYSNDRDHYVLRIPFSRLASKTSIDIGLPLTDLIQKESIVCHDDRNTWFNSSTHLTFIWTISDGGKQKQRFHFDTSSMPGFALNSTSLPPQLSIPPSGITSGNNGLWEDAEYCANVDDSGND